MITWNKTYSIAPSLWRSITRIMMDAVECMFLLERFWWCVLFLCNTCINCRTRIANWGAGQARKDNKYHCFGSNLLRVVSSMFAETYVRTYLADTLFTIKRAVMSRQTGCHPRKWRHVTTCRHVADMSPTCAAKNTSAIGLLKLKLKLAYCRILFFYSIFPSGILVFSIV